MKIGEIVKDSLRYPFSDWNKILILGIVVLLGSISSITRIYVPVNTTNLFLTLVLGIIGFIFGFLERGYFFRIIKTSLNGVLVLPEFNSWIEMFKDGIKLFIVPIIYFIPAILIILVLAVLSFKSNPSTVISILYGAIIWSLIGGNTINTFIVWAGTWGIIAILYCILIFPISLMAIAYMIENDSKLSEAFKFHKILDKIKIKGWNRLIIWYVMTGIVFLILILILIIIFVILGFLIQDITGIVPQRLITDILISIIGIPFIFGYLYRSVALFYMSEGK